MAQTGRIMFIMGVTLVGLGAVIWLFGKAGFRGLPGDLKYETSKGTFYFPIVTCVVLSLAISGLMYLWKRFQS